MRIFFAKKNANKAIVKQSWQLQSPESVINIRKLVGRVGFMVDKVETPSCGWEEVETLLTELKGMF
jgi:predicted transcriptional regulator